MGIVTLLILILLGVAIGYAAIIFQIVTLARIYRSWGWARGAAAFILLGGQKVKNIIRLPAQIIEAQLNGVMIDHLNWEQTVDVIWTYAIILLFIWWLDWQRVAIKKMTGV